MHVKNFFFLLTFLALTFAFTSFVQADGDHSNHSDISNAITNFQGNEQQQSFTKDPHSDMDHGEDHKESANNHSDHSPSVETEHHESGHSDSGHSEEGHGEESGIEETPPNAKVLGTFGLLNFGFVSLGIILKNRKRKGKIYEVK